jgi:hypothetical protein
MKNRQDFNTDCFIQYLFSSCHIIPSTAEIPGIYLTRETTVKWRMKSECTHHIHIIYE